MNQGLVNSDVGSTILAAPLTLRAIRRDSTYVNVQDKPAYTVAEVSALTGFSRRTITRMFEEEKGVLILERPEKMHKRGYRSIRIPRAVYERVVRRLLV